MTIILLLFLMLAIAGLGLVGGYALQLYFKSAQLTRDLATQHAQFDAAMRTQSESSELVKSQYQGLVNKYNEDAKKWSEYCKRLKSENQRLSKWTNIADVDAKTREMLRIARATVEKANFDANNLMASAQQQVANLRTATEQQAQEHLGSVNETASALLAEAREKSKLQKDEAQAIFSSATTQAAQIIEAANKKAEEIGGSAYEAMKNASLYERTARAAIAQDFRTPAGE